MNSRFEQLSRDEGFRALFGISHRRSCPANQVVIEQGGRPGKLYLMISGLASVRSAGSEGTEVLLAYLYPGDFFGEMCLFPRMNERSAMVRTESECSLLEVGYEPFVNLSREYPSVWLELAGQLAERLRTTNHRLANLTTLQASERVWQVIEEMARNSDAECVPEGRMIRVRREDLGRLAACSPDVAGLALRVFEQEGRLLRRGHRLVVREWPQPQSAVDRA